MSAEADQPGLSNTLTVTERKFARDAGTVWGLVLDHLVDKHVEAAAAMKINPEGGVARTPEGIVVTGKELVLQVLLNADGNYTIEGYQPRMEQSIGIIYLGMDWGPEYERQATPANAAIGRVTRREAFELAVKETRAALTTVPAPSGVIDIQAISDVVLAKLCAHWFDIPDGIYVKPGGFRISNLLSAGICPGDYTLPSGYIVHPDPDFVLTSLGQRTGQILRESVNKYVADKRAAGQLPTAPLTRAFFEEFPDPKDNDLLARTIVGVMMGALPTINGNLITIVKTWQRTATLLALQASLNASKETDEFVKAHEIVEMPMRQAMQMQPTPDWLWRLAKKDHTIGTINPVQVRAGDKIYLSITQATQEELHRGGSDVCPLFGGDRSQKPHPTHACPGFEMGFGILLGVVYGVVDFQSKS
ncbi:MAG: Cytochrome [Bradyrhizobium sp.]|nr:Cytochrome [Bradyrhizobium sp.]